MSLVVVGRQLVVVVGHLVADVPAAGVDHDPDMAVVAQLNLDEVVAAAERAELEQAAFILAGDDRQLLFRASPAELRHPPARLRFLVVRQSRAGRSGGWPGGSFSAAACRWPAARSAPCAHPAADIHPHRVGDDHTLGRRHPADGHAVANMGVGHDRHMVEEKGQIGEILGLLQGVEVDIAQPEFDRLFFGGRLF